MPPYLYTLMFRAKSLAETGKDEDWDCRRRCSSMSSWFKAWREWFRLMRGCNPLAQPPPRRGTNPPCRSSYTMCTATSRLWLPILTGCMRLWQMPGNSFWISEKRCGHCSCFLHGKPWSAGVLLLQPPEWHLLHCFDPGHCHGTASCQASKLHSKDSRYCHAYIINNVPMLFLDQHN